MGKKGKECGLLIAVLLAGVALGVVAGVVVLSLFYPAFQSDKWAAWVQAFGSIGAVIAAIYIMSRQVKAQRELKINEQKDNLDSVIQLIQRGSKWVYDYITEHILADPQQPHGVGPVIVWNEIFRDIDVTSPDLVKVAVPVTQIRLNMSVIIAILTAIENKERGVTVDGQREALQICCESIEKSAQFCPDDI